MRTTELYEPSARELDRRAYRRSRARRSTAVALASTLVFALLAYLTVTNAPGWDRTRATFFDISYGWEVLPDILEGLWLNIRVLAVAAVAVVVVALMLALLRTLRGPVFLPLRLLATAYIDLFRGMPLLIVLYLVGFGLPALRLDWLPTSETTLGTIALVLTYSAYVAEVFRAGIEAVHPSQRAAARSLGLTYRQTMRMVVLPQAVRKVTPPLLNDFVAMQKDVGLISVLGAVDAIRKAQIEVAQTFNFTPYVVAGLLFVLLAVPSARLADWVTNRAARRQQAGGLV
ncbi:amino acid ABC transporter permease [Phytoactinopolyspora halotolerans]|uniref:Amino acid ABC transporter permease n=1 Tax=Phytoactinopolyspora halotolerans TaxID=1981512 RepID=A0A6L9S4G4_9ACTN|nr:amino acid ABC transporter permease [Phytoactinopolyspora halotolerans]NED99397.1 amino acid ABC transporter permease [Phytoactinopolyspora halotolerans]